MKKNLVVMATSVALSASMAFATPAYAGVVKRNATGAAAKLAEEQAKQVDEKKAENDTKVSYENTSSQEQGDQTEQAHAGLKDQTPTDQPQKEIGRDNPMTVFPRADYLGPDGVAKDPSYVTSNFEIEKNKTIYQCVRSTGAARWLKMRQDNFAYPEINPDTGYPLWSTKPFWRQDGSFDVYGYLKQFPARKKEQTTKLHIYTDYDKRDNVVTGMQLDFTNYYMENPPYIPTDWDEFTIWLFFTTSNDMTSTNGRYFQNTKPVFVIKDFYDGKGIIQWKGCIDIDQIANAPTVKITGSENSYMYLIQVEMLEKAMKNYIQNPYVKATGIEDWVNIPSHFTGLSYLKEF
ncbi:MAG: hypothetical protein ACFNPW_02990 [Candidatus Nanosyncoccus sp.]